MVHIPSLSNITLPSFRIENTLELVYCFHTYVGLRQYITDIRVVSHGVPLPKWDRKVSRDNQQTRVVHHRYWPKNGSANHNMHKIGIQQGKPSNLFGHDADMDAPSCPLCRGFYAPHQTL